MLRNIIDIINTALKEKLDVEYNSIVTYLPNDDKVKVPTILSKDGETRSVCFDDSENGIIYHKVLTTEWGINKSTGYNQGVSRMNNFGDGYETFMQKTPVALIGYLKLSKFKLMPDEMANLIFSTIPKVLNHAQNKELKILSCQVDVQSADYDSEKVCKEEYGINQLLPANYYMLSIKYEIDVKINTACMDLCKKDCTN